MRNVPCYILFQFSCALSPVYPANTFTPTSPVRGGLLLLRGGLLGELGIVILGMMDWWMNELFFLSSLVA